MAAQCRLHDFSPQNLDNTAWSFAAAGHWDPILFDALCREVVMKVDGFQPQHLANVMYACAMFGHRDAQLVVTLCTKVMHLRGQLNSQDACNVAWSLAVLEGPSGGLKAHEGLLQGLLMALSCMWDNVLPIGKQQLFQVQLAAQVSGVALEHALSHRMWDDVHRAWEETLMPGRSAPSLLQRQVYKVVNRVGVKDAKLEHIMPDGSS